MRRLHIDSFKKEQRMASQAVQNIVTDPERSLRPPEQGRDHERTPRTLFQADVCKGVSGTYLEHVARLSTADLDRPAHGSAHV